ncbi:Lsr2 family DNA-binding protein [Jiangella alkaliphila]|uniref:Lsr2 protein n=1 Tax=Jiangella alkaliphila TaxID=419479 RepID=A0A1H2IE96_9ACTN|nr:Lsr2 family protein [Jiangella alkaliphila]SDU42311.1 Lsr2 protein [Jiangella alkaliphila]
MRAEGSAVGGGVYGDAGPDLPRESAGRDPRTERPRFQWPKPNPDGPPPGAPLRARELFTRRHITFVEAVDAGIPVDDEARALANDLAPSADVVAATPRANPASSAAERLRKLGGTPRIVRAWARANGIPVTSRGTIAYHVVDAWAASREGAVARPRIRVRSRPDGFWRWACLTGDCTEYGFKTTWEAALQVGLDHLAEDHAQAAVEVPDG